MCVCVWERDARGFSILRTVGLQRKDRRMDGMITLGWLLGGVVGIGIDGEWTLMY